jgi:hypothetical protein
MSHSPEPPVSQPDKYPRISDSINGRFVITWQRGPGFQTDGSHYENDPDAVVMAQVFTEYNVPVTDAFIVPT